MDKKALDDLFEEGAPFALVRMKTLRDIFGGGDRLGVHVVANLEKWIAECDYRHLPPRLPRSQDETVLLYRPSRVGMILDACRMACGDETMPAAETVSMLHVIAMAGTQMERETAQLTKEQREAAKIPDGVITTK